MFGDVFYFVLNMSITAALLILILLLIRVAFGRFVPKSVLYLLWGVVLFRLLVPVSIPSELSLFGLLNGSLTKTVPVPAGPAILPEINLPELSTLNSIQAADTYFPLTYKSILLTNIFAVSGWVWLGGALVILVILFILYYLAAGKLRCAELIRDTDILNTYKDLQLKKDKFPWNACGRLYRSDQVQSPVLVGVFRPRIILPLELDRQALQYALRHELAHVQRKDNFWKMVSLLAVCLHWFNPLVWLSFYLADQDREMACDARVLKGLAGEERKQYAEALVGLAAKQQTVLTAFGGTAVKRRIAGIINYKRMPLVMTAVTTVICLVLGLLLLINPVS